MHGSEGVSSGRLVLSLVAVLAALPLGCPPPPGEPRAAPRAGARGPTRKTIVSHRGELTRDSMYVGDIVRFRIYYANRSLRAAPVEIVDKLDPSLSQVKVFHNGAYDRRAHTVAWKIDRVGRLRTGFVEFEAVVGKAVAAGTSVVAGWQAASSNKPAKTKGKW